MQHVTVRSPWCEATCIGTRRACGRFETTVQCHLGGYAWNWPIISPSRYTVAWMSALETSAEAVYLATSCVVCCSREYPCRCRDVLTKHVRLGGRCVRRKNGCRSERVTLLWRCLSSTIEEHREGRFSCRLRCHMHLTSSNVQVTREDVLAVTAVKSLRSTPRVDA